MTFRFQVIRTQDEHQRQGYTVVDTRNPQWHTLGQFIDVMGPTDFCEGFYTDPQQAQQRADQMNHVDHLR